MGCDIHTFVEEFKNGQWGPSNLLLTDMWYDKKTEKPWDWRSYSMFAILAGVRNYSKFKPIMEPRGWPEDKSTASAPTYYEEDTDWCHTFSYYTLEELLNFDWDQLVEDRRNNCKKYGDADSVPEGEGEIITYREAVGDCFFKQLEEMKNYIDDPKNLRILFCFDN